ncbi:MAG: translation elongation factor-like protein [Candidatus Bipolaricaulota bacterium]|nr:translation elongation factor-like protein [Candidatus Bipolaricaulota bacterium]
MEEKPIGKVTHFFGRISVAVLDLTEPLKVGETIHIKGHTTDLTQRVESMQVEHKEIQEAKPGEQVAIKVTGRVHENDVVYKVIS